MTRGGREGRLVIPMLSRSFLAPYLGRDPLPDLLARATFRSKYSRAETPTWTETIARVVRANVALDPSATPEEAEALFCVMWAGAALPPGRGLWTGGVAGIPADARYNCWGVRLRTAEDWCWGANMLMLGGGVGFTIAGARLDPLPERSRIARCEVFCSPLHPDVREVGPDAPGAAAYGEAAWLVPDTREGWVEALRRLFRAAWEGRDFRVDVSEIRPRGSRIRTFGGVACGPGPLVHLLRSVWRILVGAAGRALTSVEMLDVTNLIGLCIKSGNVRRSALIVLGDRDDADFRRAKHDWSAVLSHRHTSNNSIVFERYSDFEGFDWDGLVRDLSQYGEPGLVNFARIHESDPGATSINPCGEVPLHDREACNLAEIFPAVAMRAGLDVGEVARLTTRYALRQRLEPLLDPEADEARTRNMRLGVALGGVCDFAYSDRFARGLYRTVRQEADAYADALGVARPNAATTVKPSGTISLLNDSAPGMHARWSPYYVRRMRISANEPIAEALREAGVPCEPCAYDATGHTLVFAFPSRAPSGAPTTRSQTLRAQFARQLSLQESWADNAVSATLTYSEGQEAELAGLLAEYAPRLKSTSCLLQTHGYAQAPYEAISADEYARLYSQIDHSHPLAAGDVEVDECAGGACPIR